MISSAAYAGIPGMIQKSDFPDWKSQLKELRASRQTPSTRSSEAPGEVITEVEGMVMPLDKTYDGFYLNMDHIENFTGMTTPTEIVIGNDGYIYIKDIISMVPTEAYIKGEFTEDGRIVFNFPQTVFFEADDYYGDMWMDVSLFHSTNTDEEIPEIVTENNTIYFSFNEDGTEFSMDPLPENTSLSIAYCPGDMWYGFSETAMSFAESKGETGGVTLPEGVEALPYSYIYDNTLYTGDELPDGKPDFGYHVNIAFDGDDVYFGGIFRDAPESWVVGRKEGDKVTLPGNQYLGTMMGTLNFKLRYAKWTSPAHSALELLPVDTEFTFIYDEATGTFTTADKDIILLINAKDDAVYALQNVEDPVYVYQPEASGAPRAPWGLKYKERAASGVFDFNLPVVTEDGVLLYTSNMYYNIYVDGELLTLYADETPDVEEDTTDIPYNLDETSIVCDILSTYHQMIIPMADISKVGVQCVNVWKGEKYLSPMVEIDIATGEITGGSGVDAVQQNVISETYHDLAGRRLMNPSEGICIIRTTYEDGSVKTTKKAVR